MKNEVVICSALSTAIGAFIGALKKTPTGAFGAHVVKAL